MKALLSLHISLFSTGPAARTGSLQNPFKQVAKTCSFRSCSYARDPSDLLMPPLGEPHKYDFQIVEESQVHRRYLTLYNRRIRFPALQSKPEEEHEYDIIGHPQLDFRFVVVFPFHPYTDGRKGGEVTILREHCQGLNDMLFTLPTGGYDPKKHSSHMDAACSELSEEAHLSGGEWVELLAPEHPGIAEVKWCRNRFRPFLCIGPKADETPGQRDAEEFIEVHRVSVAQLRDMLTSTDMLLPTMTTSFMALERLKQMGHL